MYIDVDVIDVLDDCNDWEINRVIDWLRDNDFLTDLTTEKIENPNLMEIEWEQTINKLYSLRQRLTQEEEQIIKQITNKY